MSGNRPEDISLTEKIRSEMGYMGFILPDKFSNRGRFLVVLSLFLAFECLMAVIVNWDDLYLRYTSLEDLNLTLSCSGVFLDYAIGTDKMAMLLNMVDVDLYKYNKKRGYIKMKQKLIDQSLRKNRIWAKRISLAVKLFCVNIILIKLVVKIVAAFLEGYYTVQPLIYEFVFPFHYKNYLIYLIILSLQFVHLSCIPPMTKCIYITGVIVMKGITTELQLLCISIQEISCKSGYTAVSSDVTQMTVSSTSKMPDLQLQLHMKNLVQRHQLLIKNVAKLNKGIAITATFVNQTIGISICLSLYCFVEEDDIILRLKALSSMIACMFLLLLYSFCGQVISNEADNFKEELYFCSWLDKPEWFKKTLSIMMTCSNRTILVKPLGLYVLNLKSYSTVLNAAYSFFNVLKSIRK